MLDRRAFLSVFSQLGLSATLLPGVLWSMATNKNRITRETMDQAALVADIEIPEEYKDMLLERLNRAQGDFAALRELRLPNHVPPALVFDPLPPGTQLEAIRRPAKLSRIQHRKSVPFRRTSNI